MFELGISKAELLPRLLMVAGAVDKKQSLAILSNILIRIDNNVLTLTATDLEMEISAHLPCEASFSDRKITVPAKKFIDIIRSLDDESVPRLTFQDGTVFISSGRSRFKLATLPADDFPASDKEATEVEFSLPKADLIHLLQSTHFAMSQQDVRFFLNGLLLEFDGLTITAVATDGHRMAICKRACDSKLPHHRLLLPRKGIQELLRLLNTIQDDTLTVVAGKSSFRLISTEYAFSSKLIESRFPPYNKAIPVGNDKFVLLEKDNLKRALSRIIILANEKSRAVLMHLHDSTLTLVANNQEQEEATEILEATVDGDELKIGINASYLLDVLNYLPDGLVRLSMSTTDRSVLVESLLDELYQYIIMPMKL
ncbi:DNA polymerase III subunit beta [Legionella sp. CNM-4043-24]|uniref:DNA polymerase III subunit beta n=1 Tax=Legionella sp. CNM-4043-24 TaxID=3421646 RepID=UPI00403B0735